MSSKGVAMAIGFIRMEFVKRSEGKCVCAKSAYNSRSKVVFEGNEFNQKKTYDWSRLEKPIYHEVLLPAHVNSKFKSAELLWNEVEKSENRSNSQLALDVVFALPDDACISDDDRMYLARLIVQKLFIDYGLAAQIDIHKPDGGHNWHVHALLTTRRFSECGMFLGEKARDLMPVVRNGKVISGRNLVQEITDIQNQFFEERGLSLRVDPKGTVPQKHLGPVRMRARAFALIAENNLMVEINKEESLNPEKILKRITENKSVFSIDDIENFFAKHVDASLIPQVREEFWKHHEIETLLDKNTSVESGKYTTKNIYREESQILRISERIYEREALTMKKGEKQESYNGLNAEQKAAYENVVNGQRLSLIEGHAGTGKSYLLTAFKDAYASSGYTVRSFGPDNATADVLKEKGFSDSENIYKFLFSYKKSQREISAGKEVWILDEAGKLGNSPLLEMLKLAEKYKVQLVLSGCSAQLASVERGGMFKVLTERYGASHLEDIQRQQDLHQREIAKKLAKGEMSLAIDAIVKTGGLRWTATREEAIEELIKKWASDRTIIPGASNLIIAHTNAEVRLLNEMVRVHLRENGEIGEKEFKCETPYGKIYVSTGDKIEFRMNDSSLGVTNHMKGILVKADEKKFTVAIEKEGKTKEISFNPSEYSHFQLGYATTFYSSQGKTVDRGYVLLSPYLNKELFYVGLTRHVKEVNLYVSKTDYNSLSALKWKAFRSGSKETSLSYISKSEHQRKIDEDMKYELIEELKAADSLFSKAKGYSLSTFEGLKNAANGILEKYKDRKLSQSFFNPTFPDKTNEKSGKKVFAVTDPDFSDPKKSEDSVQQVQSLPNEKEKAKVNVELSQEAKHLLNEYKKSWQYVSSLREHMSKNGKKIAISELQEACIRRIELAFQVMEKISKSDIGNILGNESYEIILEQSLRYESQEKKQKITHSDIESELKSHMESLLHKIFPDGPTRKDRWGFRFGSKGSLSVVCQGKNQGSYYDFEKGEGGGPIQLIQQALGFNYDEAKEWAKDFLGHAKELPGFTTFAPVKISQNKEEWISLVPPSNQQSPPLNEISSTLAGKYKEVARHVYANQQNQTLFYILRLIDKEKPSEKTCLPLSYGHWSEEDPAKAKWWIKAYQTKKGRPLYNIMDVVKNTEAAVLIVEGEKTADAAKKMFVDENIVCVTWSGGSSAVSKTDWSPLFNRKVIIWPDNDPPGYQASDEICAILRHVGVKSIEVVDKTILKKELPEKWDLADPLPKGKESNFIRDMLIRAQEKSVNFDQFLLSIEAKNEGKKFRRKPFFPM